MTYLVILEFSDAVGCQLRTIAEANNTTVKAMLEAKTLKAIKAPARKPWKRMTREQRIQAVQMRGLGMTYAQIGQRLGYTGTAVSNVVRKIMGEGQE